MRICLSRSGIRSFPLRAPADRPEGWVRVFGVMAVGDRPEGWVRVFGVMAVGESPVGSVLCGLMKGAAS